MSPTMPNMSQVPHLPRFNSFAPGLGVIKKAGRRALIYTTIRSTTVKWQIKLLKIWQIELYTWIRQIVVMMMDVSQSTFDHKITDLYGFQGHSDNTYTRIHNHPGL